MNNFWKWFCTTSMIVGMPHLIYYSAYYAKAGSIYAVCSVSGYYCDYVPASEGVAVASSTANQVATLYGQKGTPLQWEGEEQR